VLPSGSIRSSHNETEEFNMDLSELLRAECVAVNITAASKADALLQIAALAKRSPSLDKVSVEDIHRALAEREALGSTGFGKGIAIPHCRMDSVSAFVVGLATVDGTVDFASLDGKPVGLIAFIVGPAQESTDHIRVLSGLSRVLSDADAVKEMLAATTPEGLRESFLRHVSLDRELRPEAKRSLFHVFVQDEDLFQEILQVMGGTEPRFTAVLEAENASAYLAKLPLFAGLWADRPRSFTRVVVSLVNRSMTNELVRRIEQVAGPLAESQRVLVTVQNVFFSGGSLTT
jgi:mannitol/fructose-specific phosphotransferase system IIA component (Ntr-type)